MTGVPEHWGKLKAVGCWKLPGRSALSPWKLCLTISETYHFIYFYLFIYWDWLRAAKAWRMKQMRLWHMQGSRGQGGDNTYMRSWWKVKMKRRVWWEEIKEEELYKVMKMACLLRKPPGQHLCAPWEQDSPFVFVQCWLTSRLSHRASFSKSGAPLSFLNLLTP